MNDDYDPDWEEEARKAESSEGLNKALREWQRRIRKAKLDVKKQPRGTRIVVSMFEEDGDPFATGPIEFTILDPAKGKVLVKNERNFAEPTEGTLLGCEHFTSRPYKRLFQKGKLEIGWWLNYEVRGEKFDRNKIFQTIRDIVIILPSGVRFDLWKDLSR